MSDVAQPNPRHRQPRSILLEGLFENSLDGVLLVEIDGRVLRANPAACRALGRAEAELIRLGRRGVVVADEALATLLAGRTRDGVSRGQITFRRAGGATFPAEATTGLIDAGDGKLAAYVIFRDLSETRRVEAEIRRQLEAGQERESWLQATQQVARLGHYVFDISLDTWTSSAVLDQIFGIDLAYPRDLAGWLALVDPDEREEMARYFDGLLASGARFDREYQLATRPGEPPRWVHGLGELVRDETGRPVKLFGVIQDVTARRESEQAGAELAGQLRQAQRLESIGRLAGGVAHDFNNILVVFLTCVDALRRSLAAGRPPALEDVEELDAATRRARELTSQLLTFARKQVVAPVPLDLNEVVRRVQRLLGRLLGEDIQLVLDLQPGIWTVRCDAGQLEQVIMNLATNARDAMPRGGRLTIRTRNVEAHGDLPAPSLALAPGRHALLIVEDSGTGLSLETRAHLFEPFHTTKPPGKGTGLGLASVHGIVSQAGGVIGVRSEEGRGTTFEIALPCVDDPALESPRGPRGLEGQTGPARAERILLVEDDSLVRDATSRALRDAGYDVLTAATGAEALAVAAGASPPPCLLLTDVVMPGMNGHQVAAAVRALVPGLRVLFMSGYAQDIIVHRGVVDPGVELLQKPFSTAEFLERIRGLLDSPPPRGAALSGAPDGPARRQRSARPREERTTSSPTRKGACPS